MQIKIYNEKLMLDFVLVIICIVIVHQLLLVRGCAGGSDRGGTFSKE